MKKCKYCDNYVDGQSHYTYADGSHCCMKCYKDKELYDKLKKFANHDKK